MASNGANHQGRIAVAGATGRVGRHVVEVLAERGYLAVPISRANGVDLISGNGLAEALEGVEGVIDAATGPSPEQGAATEFFTTAAANLQQAGARAGVNRIVVVSIIGCDRFSGGYAAAKVAHEQTALAGPLPVSILRAAQFHEFVEQLLDWGRQGEVAYVPQMRTQLVAARTAAEALVDLATAPEPVPGDAPIPEIAGPREESMVAMARLLATKRGETVQVEGVSDPSDPDHDVYVSGALLPSAHATLAGPTFAEWVEEHLPVSQL
jgi:uncharacterized protein YbjT (DUF2867 family)